ncbi:MAG: hypothetical protein LBM64_04245 [Deltaproteobacteria bacterium]|nr:hypothetical protein [Deltaproteobacteria bacterium]
MGKQLHKGNAWYDVLLQPFSEPEASQFCVLVLRPDRYNLLIDWQEARDEF